MTNHTVQIAASGTLTMRGGTMARQVFPAFHKPIYDVVDGVGTRPITSASLARGIVHRGCAAQMGD
jgi:hypothetical protein